MHRGLYKTFDVPNGYIMNRHTKENLGTHVDLYCYTADENNIYYETPHIDYPENYVHVLPDGQEICIADYMQQNGEFSVPFAIISDHTKLTGVERFHIDECNRFYSVPITPEIANFLYSIGLENFFVRDKIWNYKLLELQARQERSYTELLFFMDSNDPNVRVALNNFRYKVLRYNLQNKVEEMIAKGVCADIVGGIVPAFCRVEDEYFIEKAIVETADKFKNGGKHFKATHDNMIKVKADMEHNISIITEYAKVLTKFYEKLLVGRNTTLGELLALYPNQCPFDFGFTNDEISRKVKKIIC